MEFPALNYALEQRRRLRVADARWLLVGVAAHVALLLVPLGEFEPGAFKKTARLVVRLMSQPAFTPTPESAPGPRETEPPRSAKTPIRVPEIHNPVMDHPLPSPADPVAPPEPGMSAARLYNLRETVTEEVPLEHDERTTLRLGETPATGLPPNWRAGAGAEAFTPFDNLLNGKTVPADVEIVDRWLAADGSHNVVVETPAGLRMCGRAEAWDPARPVIEPVMMFRVCGGDGKREFKFTPRKKLDREFIEAVAKDANQP